MLKFRRRKEKAERRLDGHRGQPHPPPGPAPRGPPPASAARAPGRRGPPPRRGRRRAAGAAAATSPVGSSLGCSTRLESSGPRQDASWPSKSSPASGLAAPARRRRDGHRGRAVGHGRRRPRRRARPVRVAARAGPRAGRLSWPSASAAIERDRGAFGRPGCDRHPRGRGGPPDEELAEVERERRGIAPAADRAGGGRGRARRGARSASRSTGPTASSRRVARRRRYAASWRRCGLRVERGHAEAERAPGPPRRR